MMRMGSDLGTGRRSIQKSSRYGVATVSRIDKIIGLFCKRDL